MYEIPIEKSYLQYFLGYIYYKGEHVCQNIDKSISLLEKASNQNNSNAQCYLGAIYYNSQYISRDINKSIHYLTLSANQNKSDAQCLLGEIYYTGEYNKRILFLLLEKGFVKPDESFIKKYLQNVTNKDRLNYYLYPKMKEFLEEKIQKQIEEKILKNYAEEISTFEEKCQIGENDLYICSLIRSDSVEDFITYVNRTNLSLLTKIKPSVYETNSFLIDNNPSLIEYAAFFGSIQIIRYLKYNNVPLTPSLWLYTVHSNNAELIHFLEENEVKPEMNKNKESFDDVLIESIKCHHNAISDYIKDNFYEQMQENDENQFYDNFSDSIIDSLNFFL